MDVDAHVRGDLTKHRSDRPRHLDGREVRQGDSGNEKEKADSNKHSRAWGEREGKREDT